MKKQNRMSPCPDSPNCVSSQSDDKKHYVEPFNYTGSLNQARLKMLGILKSSSRIRLITIEENYIHAEFRSLIFRFVDDFELWFPGEKNIIHVKSASRAGYSDFGANRKRVEYIRNTFGDGR